MKPSQFEWLTASSVAECLSALAEDPDGDTKIIAGGQSLIPLMSLGLAAPLRLVDVTRLEDLNTITECEQSFRIGAVVTHATLVAKHRGNPEMSFLASAAKHIGHPAIRNRGTLGGSLAHADRASELAAAMLLLGARVGCQSATGSRWVSAENFFLGPYTTVLEPEEMITSVEVDIRRPQTLYGFAEFSPREGDFARSGAACAIEVEPLGAIKDLRVVIFAATPTPVVVSRPGDARSGESLDTFEWEAYAQALSSSAEPGFVRDLTVAVLLRAFDQARRSVPLLSSDRCPKHPDWGSK